MTLGLASPPCGLMHDNSARANTQANHSRWHAHKCLTNNADCACHRERVGEDFERTEGRRESNRLPCGPDRAHPRHTQNRREPRVVCGKQKWKRPTEKGWALNSGGGLYHSVELSSITPAGWCGSTRSHAASAPFASLPRSQEAKRCSHCCSKTSDNRWSASAPVFVSASVPVGVKLP